MIAILKDKRTSLLSSEHWIISTLADVIVGVVVLLPAMTSAIASELKSKQSIYAAIVADGLTTLFGGFAYTDAITLNATNIRNSASSPLTGIVHNLQGVHLL